MLVTICHRKDVNAKHYVELAKKMGYDVVLNNGLYQTTVLNDGLSWQNPNNEYVTHEHPVQEYVFKVEE